MSVHDFRSLRKASVHFIAAEMARRGPTRFFSVGLSRLSEWRGDTRAGLAGRANRIEAEDGVECYLWRTAWHPFNVRKAWLLPLEAAMFAAYRRMAPPVLRRWIREADVVFIESGMGPVFIADVRRLNPSARIVYLASDDLDVVGCARTIKRAFRRDFDLIDTVRLPSRHLLSGMPHARSAVLVPHGIDSALNSARYPDPYAGRPACVSVGSMLFDAGFFAAALPLFPGLEFHLIGAGAAAARLRGPNLVVHGEMAFADTLPFLQHAAFGVAPYRDVDAARYLIDTSLKLRQFGLFGIPAVCPDFAADRSCGRIGYRPGDSASIEAAIRAALAHDAPISVEARSWAAVAERILHPQAFGDTRL